MDAMIVGILAISLGFLTTAIGAFELYNLWRKRGAELSGDVESKESLQNPVNDSKLVKEDQALVVLIESSPSGSEGIQYTEVEFDDPMRVGKLVKVGEVIRLDGALLQDWQRLAAKARNSIAKKEPLGKG